MCLRREGHCHHRWASLSHALARQKRGASLRDRASSDHRQAHPQPQLLLVLPRHRPSGLHSLKLQLSAEHRLHDRQATSRVMTSLWANWRAAWSLAAQELLPSLPLPSLRLSINSFWKLKHFGPALLFSSVVVQPEHKEWKRWCGKHYEVRLTTSPSRRLRSRSASTS